MARAEQRQVSSRDGVYDWYCGLAVAPALAVGAAQILRRRPSMTALEWLLSMTLFMTYVFCLFTVCALTFKNGRACLAALATWLRATNGGNSR
jgi:hypothetical protein